MKKKKEKWLWTTLLTASSMLIFIIGVLASDQILHPKKEQNQNMPTEENENYTIYLNHEVVMELNKLYENKNEVSSCLIGQLIQNAYIITKAVQNPAISQTPTSITITQCREQNVLGNVHTHPSGACALSLKDAYSFAQTQNNITGVICGPNQFAFFTPQQLNTPIPTKIGGNII
jgi:proteasome lid subunit RPN8/RPN11